MPDSKGHRGRRSYRRTSEVKANEKLFLIYPLLSCLPFPSLLGQGHVEHAGEGPQAEAYERHLLKFQAVFHPLSHLT